MVMERVIITIDTFLRVPDGTFYLILRVPDNRAPNRPYLFHSFPIPTADLLEVD